MEVDVLAKMDSLQQVGLFTTPRPITTDADGSSTSDLDLIAHPAIAISGRIVPPDDKKLPDDARLILERGATRDTQFAFIGRGGAFEFHAVPAGEHVSLMLDAPGFRFKKNGYTRGGTYILQSLLEHGTREFTILAEAGSAKE